MRRPLPSTEQYGMETTQDDLNRKTNDLMSFAIHTEDLLRVNVLTLTAVIGPSKRLASSRVLESHCFPILTSSISCNILCHQDKNLQQHLQLLGNTGLIPDYGGSPFLPNSIFIHIILFCHGKTK